MVCKLPMHKLNRYKVSILIRQTKTAIVVLSLSFFRKNILIVITFLLSASANAQWRLDGGVRMGRSNLRFMQDEDRCKSYLPMTFHASFSWGADANAGYEFKHGLGLYSGALYDHIRTYGALRGYRDAHGVEHKMPLHKHSFDFMTVPLRLEYRTLRNVVRPYVGLGASFLVHKGTNYTWDRYGRGDKSDPYVALFTYHKVTPTLLFGLNLEYKRLIAGIAVRRDLNDFWEDDTQSMSSFRVRQVTGKIGYRIF